MSKKFCLTLDKTGEYETELIILRYALEDRIEAAKEQLNSFIDDEERKSAREEIRVIKDWITEIAKEQERIG